jgi:hypothetical protein
MPVSHGGIPLAPAVVLVIAYKNEYYTFMKDSESEHLCHLVRESGMSFCSKPVQHCSCFSAHSAVKT